MSPVQSVMVRNGRSSLFSTFSAHVEHALVLVGGRLGRGDRDELAFRELVLADHAARVAPGGAGFGAEARRERGEAQRQLVLGEDLLAHEVGERHFGRRDQPKRASLKRLRDRIARLAFERCQRDRTRSSADAGEGPELIVLEFRQLRRAEHRVVAHQQRRR